MNLDRARRLLSKLPVKDRDANISVPFILNPNQVKAFDLIKQAYALYGWIRIICLKARRVGMSSFFDALLFCHCIARAQAHAEIVAHLKEVSEKGLFRVPRDLGEALNEKVECCEVRTRDIIFHHQDGDSRLDIATAGSVGGGRGLTLTALHLSEAAQYPGSDSFLGILPAVSKAPDTFIALESTAFGRVGIGQTFYDFWQRANKKGKDWNGYTPIFLSWLDDPGCVAPNEAEDAPATDLERELMKKPFCATRKQIAWMRLVLEGECDGSEAKFSQEYPWCVTGDTKVSTELGIMPVTRAVALNCKETESGKIERIWKQEPSSIYRLETEKGRTLRATGNHPVMTSGGFYKLSQLQVGTDIELRPPRFAEKPYVLRWQDFYGMTSEICVDEVWARFIGYFMGDGSWYKKYISIVCDPKDWDVQKDVEATLTKLLGRRPVPREVGKKKGRKGAVEYRISSADAEPAFLRLGIIKNWETGQWKRKVHVPECILQSPKHIVAEFLRSLFECDGSASSGSVRFASAKREFIQDIQLLLLGFGIDSRIYENKKQSGSRKEYICYELTVSTETVKLFEQIGFVGMRKRQLLEEIMNRRSVLKSIGSFAFFGKTLWDTVKSIVIEPKAEATYDFTVEGEHVFSANGILTHNTPHVAFVATGDPAFNSQELQYARQTLKKPLANGHLERNGSSHVFVESRGGKFFLYEKPQPKCWYYIGADCARGMEAETGLATGDFAAYVVLNGTTGKIAARFSDWINPEQIAEDLDKAGRWYNQAMINIELTGNLGLWAQKLMRDTYFYPNLYVWRGKDDASAGKHKRHSLGWETTARTRDLLYSTFRGKLREGMKNIPGGLEICDAELLTQMDLATMGIGMRWEVEHGHDDILIAALLAVIACAQYPPPNIAQNRANYLETKESKHASIQAALRPQATLQTALKRDLDFIMRPDKQRHHSVLGKI